MYVGSVYVRLYLKQPTYRLSNPIYFLEKLVEFWEVSFEAQVPAVAKAVVGSYDNQQLILGKEDFLSLITSCIVCLVKAEGNAVEHLLSWGFTQRLCMLLQRALDGNRY